LRIFIVGKLQDNIMSINFTRFIQSAFTVCLTLLIGVLAHAAEATSGSASTATAPPPIEHFFKDVAFSNPVLSPNGKLIAFLVGGAQSQKHKRLAVLDLETLKPQVIASFNEAGISHFEWVNDKRLVFTLATELTGPGRVDFGSGLFAVDVDGGKFRQLVETTRSFLKSGDDQELLPWNNFLHSSIGLMDTDDVLIESPGEISKDKIDYRTLKRLNTRTGRVNEFDAPVHSSDWLLDSKGKLRAVQTHEKDKVTVQYLDGNDQWKKLTEYDTFSSKGFSLEHLDQDGKLYVTASAGKNTTALYTYDFNRNALSSEPIVSSKSYDIHPTLIRTSQKLLGVRYKVDGEVTQWFDAEMKAVQADVDKRLTQTANQISVPLRSETPFVLVRSYSDKQPRNFYLYNTATKKLVHLGGHHPEINPKQMGEMDMVRYKAGDELEIPAYITLPPGGVKKNLPMVVLVHGGPWVRGATWEWEDEVQFLATHGYAVLQPEFRGSTGFGNHHFTEGWKQWGLKMQSDIADGARWAIAQGIADPKRICIAGASYGGYSTLMGLINDPDLFRCGINWVGVTDISLMYSVSWSDFNNEWKTFGMPKLIGDPVKDAEQFKATSPIANASKIKQPLLMAYGGYDVRVPIVHGEKFRDAVKPHNPQVEWIEYKEEGHGWAKVETRIDFWTRVEKFLAQHLAPR
jgi:dipeptidyl aminopeptidase/acylaminoacyl peptidase